MVLVCFTGWPALISAHKLLFNSHRALLTTQRCFPVFFAVFFGVCGCFLVFVFVAVRFVFFVWFLVVFWVGVPDIVMVSHWTA